MFAALKRARYINCMVIYALLLAPVLLLAVMWPLVRQALRYVIATALLAPVAVAVGLLAQWFYRPPRSFSLDAPQAILVGVAAWVVAGWAAMFATIAAAAVNRWSACDSRARMAVGCAAAGAIVGAAFPIAVVASVVGRAAIEQFFWIGLYVPGLIAGALCGALLPGIAFRRRPLG